MGIFGELLKCFLPAHEAFFFMWLLSALGLTQLTPVLSDERELVALIAGGERRSSGPVDHLDLHLLEVLARAAAIAMRDVQASSAAQRSFIDTAGQLIAIVEGRYEHLRGHSARVHDLALRIADQAHLGDVVEFQRDDR